MTESKPSTIGKSIFFSKLSKYYAYAPSAVIIRTAEAELLSSLSYVSPSLDLCCGDGYFASLICPDGFDVGVDISQPAITKAAELDLYESLHVANVSQRIPSPDNFFETIVSNSSLEHIEDINSTLKEVARVLKPGGRFYTTFPSNFTYEWWPESKKSLKRYLEFQPVYNCYKLKEWDELLRSTGLLMINHQYYLSEMATKLAMFLDYHFSHVYLTADPSWARPLIKAMHLMPTYFWSFIWRIIFPQIKIQAIDQGGGILIIAEKKHISP